MEDRVDYKCIWSWITNQMIHTLNYGDVTVGYTVTLKESKDENGETYEHEHLEVNPNFIEVDTQQLLAIEKFLAMDIKPAYVYEVCNYILEKMPISEEAKNL